MTRGTEVLGSAKDVACDLDVDKSHSHESDVALDTALSKFLTSAVQRMINLVPDSSLKDLAVAVGVIYDKRALLRGEVPPAVAQKPWNVLIGHVNQQIAVFQNRVAVRRGELKEAGVKELKE